ncbi:hypothetical protein DL765_007665 [Monosporascus sp. GIB2]|nr:hypothetical protein DL765_007665 [Monosporascus sp. GIB2]
MQSGLLKSYYEELAQYRCAIQAASYVDLLSHQTPALSILEVGGGTRSATRNLIRALRPHKEDSTWYIRCNRYDFTDISPAFLDDAKEEFAAFHSQMTFGTLDVERDFVEQGYQEGVYDLVVADNVLHVTSDLAKTLRNVRRALKPGGKLLIHELLNPSGWTAGFVFGVFPGWWRGLDDSRVLSPNITSGAWDSLLRQNGFSGVDLVLKDFDQDVAHHLGWIISTATDEAPSVGAGFEPKRQATIIISQGSAEQQTLAESLITPLKHMLRMEPRKITIESVDAWSQERPKDELVIFLVDYVGSFLETLKQRTWTQLQTLVQASRHLLWVTSGGGRTATPGHGMLDGLARTLRAEYYELHLVTLALDIANANTNKASYLMKVASEMVEWTPGHSYEEEYLEVDGLLHIRRLIEARYLKANMDARLTPYEFVPTPCLSNPETVPSFLNMEQIQTLEVIAQELFSAQAPRPQSGRVTK